MNNYLLNKLKNNNPEYNNNIPSKGRLINRWKYIKDKKIESIKCYVCDYQNNIEYFKEYLAQDMFYAGLLKRYQCPNCELIFGDLRFINLSLDEISKDYQDVYTFFSEHDTTEYIIKSLDSVNCLDDKSKSYLDFACGDTNGVITELKHKGYNIIGYDKYTNNKDYILKELNDNKFDIIFSNNYIEHVINPIEDIKYILSHINTGGKLVLISSCFEYAIEYTHYHTFFFIGKSLDILCQKTGMKLVESKKLDLDKDVFTYVKVFEKL